jgi:hypothetical protein
MVKYSHNSIIAMESTFDTNKYEMSIHLKYCRMHIICLDDYELNLGIFNIDIIVV